jgi:hypothetical protein
MELPLNTQFFQFFQGEGFNAFMSKGHSRVGADGCQFFGEERPSGNR